VHGSEGGVIWRSGCHGPETDAPGCLQVSLKTVVAAAFKHWRKDSIQKTEFIFFLTIDKKWMNKDQAERLLHMAEEEGLITFAGGALTPSFNLDEVPVPLGFKPSSDIFKERDPISGLLARIAASTGREEREIVSDMNSIIDEKFDGHLCAEAAAVLLARHYGVPFEDLLNDLQSGVTEKKQGN